MEPVCQIAIEPLGDFLTWKSRNEMDIEIQEDGKAEKKSEFD